MSLLLENVQFLNEETIFDKIKNTYRKFFTNKYLDKDIVVTNSNGEKILLLDKYFDEWLEPERKAIAKSSSLIDKKIKQLPSRFNNSIVNAVECLSSKEFRNKIGFISTDNILLGSNSDPAVIISYVYEFHITKMKCQDDDNEILEKEISSIAKSYCKNPKLLKYIKFGITRCSYLTSNPSDLFYYGVLFVKLSEFMEVYKDKWKALPYTHFTSSNCSGLNKDINNDYIHFVPLIILQYSDGTRRIEGYDWGKYTADLKKLSSL